MATLNGPVKTNGWLAKDGRIYTTVEEAQRTDLALLFNPDNVGPTEPLWSALGVAAHVLEHTDAVIAILTTGPKSRPGARKKAGTSNPKRAVTKGHTPAPTSAPMTTTTEHP